MGESTGSSPLVVLLTVPVLAMTIFSIATELSLHPDPDSFWAYSDMLDIQDLPTWWQAILLMIAAMAALVTGWRLPDSRWWCAAAVSLVTFSICGETAVHTRLDGLGRQFAGDSPLTRDWLPFALPIWVLLAVPFVVLARHAARGDHAREAGVLRGTALLTAVAVFGASGLAGELVQRVDGGTPAPAPPTVPVPAPVLITANLAFGVHLLAATALLVVMGRAVPALRCGAGIRLVDGDRVGASPPPAFDERAARRRSWRIGLAVTLGLGLASLLVILPFPDPPHSLVGWVNFLDLDHESNLATWWSVTLLAVAALGAVLAGRLAGLGGARRTALGWYVTAVMIGGMSLDDETTVHERLGEMIKPNTHGAGGQFPYLWLVPGSLVALVVIVIVVRHATVLRGRTRWLLVVGLGVFLGCALGVEGLEGVLIAHGACRTVQVIGYHVEEIGENLGVLLMIAAAFTAITIRRAQRDLTLRYAAAATGESPAPAPPDGDDRALPPEDPTDILSLVTPPGTATLGPARPSRTDDPTEVLRAVPAGG